MVTEAVSVQLLLSVTVTVYEPAERPLAVAAVCTGLVFQEYVFPPLPPDTVTVAVPFEPPLQETDVADMVAASAAGCEIVAVAVFEQPLASVTVTV